ncbi:type II CRISPR-associated endonuclease Cas1 [Flavihumibacter stibioxidans]|uniref:CRISPR-associated endonuclease Cas1 n=1 Tax=Flavihumibacter stibioxidans TaxID=1834163 RepID=A0ABR7MDB6_9BACT|nr:type II CRISPR-associated endonuclease Cas1 [Flavihumibacter stibioxidans]MBC6493020.1 subtype II CRISPR-associated endonuclease Cas1 [Flavihumibacter stibioxidans]
MVKRTLYFGNPAYLRVENEQLKIELRESGEIRQIPIEDIGYIILDNQQIVITQVAIAKLLENNTALITCDQTHHPVGLMLNLDGNNLQSQKFQAQIDASVPLKKQLWQQTVMSKIQNQASVLENQRISGKALRHLVQQVKSGDAENHEAQAAASYWKQVFPEYLSFRRERHGPPPNNLLNYGYAILRAMVARSLTGSGLLPTLGIHHRNQYNAYCLADDIMEPFRPFVDLIVCRIIRQNGQYLEMTPSMRAELLKIPQMDVLVEGRKSPMMASIQRTTASLARCFEGKAKKIIYPELETNV